MCQSARADLYKEWEEGVLRCVDLGSVNKGHCLAERRISLLQREKESIEWVKSGSWMRAFSPKGVPSSSSAPLSAVLLHGQPGR